MAGKLTEQQIANAIQQHMEKNGYDVYPEVVVKGFGGRPDLVGVKNKVMTHLIECKVSINTKLLDQVFRWYNRENKMIPNMISIGIQHDRLYDKYYVKRLLKDYGIGVYTVKEIKTAYYYGQHVYDVGDNTKCLVTEVLEPRFIGGSRRKSMNLLNQLHDDMKIAVSGSKGGETEYMTPFKRTVNKVKLIMSDNKPRTAAQIVDEMNESHNGHHYSNNSSAKQAIIKSFFMDLANIDYHGKQGRTLMFINKGN